MTQQIGKLIRILTAMLLVAMAVPTVAAESAPAQADYPLGPGDELKINVFDHPELQTELRVSEGGSITFPLIGRSTSSKKQWRMRWRAAGLSGKRRSRF
jgi:protein involved in polysaccharide export with SLBB domain